MIQDPQTDQRWWFVCDDWLPVDEGDGKIERILYPASKKDLTKFNVLFTSEVRKNLTDGHIWFSVVARPPRSNFTRVQRLTCCLFILITTLIANAMFYRMEENETPKNAIKIMGFSFSIRQVSIAIMSSMIVFPASLIIETIFRKAKPKASQYEVKSGKSEGDGVDIETGEEKKKSSRKFALPDWFVYVAYVIAFIATCTSASFVIFGMEFGRDKSVQWLSSIMVSFIQDVLFTQPIKMYIMATQFAFLISVNVIFGMEFGWDKSVRWLSSIMVSLVEDVLFTQPIKMFIMATLFAFLIAEQESFTDRCEHNAIVY